MAAAPVTIAALLAGAIAWASQALPEGEGRALVAERCTSCHDLDRIVRTRRDRDGWASVIGKMVENGARLDAAERQTAITYLSAHVAPPPRTSDEAAVERIARRYITGICSSCHDTDLITTTRATPAEWLEIVEEMNGKGAGLSEADVKLLAGYLARTYPAE